MANPKKIKALCAICEQVYEFDQNEFAKQMARIAEAIGVENLAQGQVLEFVCITCDQGAQELLH